MNTNKKTKNIKVNKAIDNMEFTNSFDALKAAENKVSSKTDEKKNTNNLY
jgi:hypothetical protein